MESSAVGYENSDNKTDFLLIPAIKPSHSSSFGCPGHGAFFLSHRWIAKAFLV